MSLCREKRRTLDAKAEKSIRVGYSDEQKGYKCYNPRMKQVLMSRDVVFDELASWYTLPTPTPDEDLISEDEASEPEEVQVEDEDFGTLEESPISFWLSGPNEELSPDEQPFEFSASKEYSVVLSLRQKPSPTGPCTMMEVLEN